ncbi:MAG: hypothetical protein AAF666_18755 [Pseudomonadota bacterium]
MTAPRYFAIIGTMRTGSNLLEQTLDALDGTVCYGEAFNPFFVGGPNREDIHGWTRDARDADPMGFLRALIDGAEGKLPGFRIFDGHDRRILAHVLGDPDCARIILRRDLLDAWVSLQIARATGQWMLRDPRRGASMKIPFDAEEFEAYQEEMAAHYGWIDTHMHRTGCTALQLTYNDLADAATFRRAADWVGCTGALPEEAPTVRQNPVAMRDKVENYEEMCAHLDMVPEPKIDRPLVRAGEAVLAPNLPVGVLPIDGPALLPVLAIVHRVEVGAHGGEKLGRGQLAEQVSQGEFMQTGLTAGALKAQLEGRLAVAVISHPLVRVFGLFVAEMTGPGWRHVPVRRALAKEFGTLPPARRFLGDQEGLDPDLMKPVFLRFLDHVEACLEERGPLGIRPGLASQSQVLDAWRAHAPDLAVYRLEALADLAAAVTARVGDAQLPPGQIRAAMQMAPGIPDYIGSDAEITARVAKIYPQDYAAFGYRV